MIITVIVINRGVRVVRIINLCKPHSWPTTLDVVHCYLVGVSMCLIHQDVLFAPRYEFLSVSS